MPAMTPEQLTELARRVAVAKADSAAAVRARLVCQRSERAVNDYLDELRLELEPPAGLEIDFWGAGEFLPADKCEKPPAI